MDLDMNKIYLDQSKDYLIAFQKMVLEMSFNFMGIDHKNYEMRVDHLLKSIGKFFEVDRTYLFTINHENQTIIYSNEWCEEGILPLVDRREKISLEIYPWWINQLQQNNLVYVEDVDLMSAEASVEQEHLRKQGVKSIISMPITVNGEIEAFIGIDSVKSTGKWSQENIELLRIMAQILSIGITQINYLKEINFLAYHDPLTKLPSRLLLTKRLDKKISQSNTKKDWINILFINLDGFKIINDTLGYQQGDELLKQVAERLVNLSGKNKNVYRIDGDQFVLCLKDQQREEESEIVASEIIDLFKVPFLLKGGEYTITASIGISQYPVDGKDAELLIESAYMAMDKAKSLGKNQYLRYSDELKKETLETLLLTNDLYHAIKRDEMMLYYQPQVNGLTGKIMGVEALLRWKHPMFGFVSPFKFIPLAEKTRLILPIGSWVLETACAQWREWQEKGIAPINLSVNFSVRQLSHPRIVEEIQEVLEKNNMRPEMLGIEITESVAIDSNKEIQETLQKIKKLGITLSIDDYGKEYSSMNRLKEESVDALKVDMSFIQGIGINPKDEIIIKSILSLASELGLKSVAEGVETKEQKEFLNQTTCDKLQGYYFYKPMPATEIEKLLTPN